MSKKAINLWVDKKTYDWIRIESMTRDITMTALLKQLIKKEQERLENERRPKQF